MAIPVILDTDIGFDVDDVWALAFLLRCPELDVKLVVTDSGNTHYSARVAAKLLSTAGREDVPVGIGIPQGDLAQTHAKWLGGYSLDDYPGVVHENGVDALCNTIMASDEPVTLICIGPVPNIAAALTQEPRLTDKSRFVGMHGSLRRGYLGAEKPVREYNVKAHPLACQRVFATPWDKTITPLDTCGTVVLKDQAFAAIRRSNKPLTSAVMANHFGWFDAVLHGTRLQPFLVGDRVASRPRRRRLRDAEGSVSPAFRDWDPNVQSSILYDTVAVYLAFADDYLVMQELPLIVTDDGKTLIDDTGQPVRCATAWRDYAAFEALLVDRLV